MKTRAPRLGRRREGSAPKARRTRARTITIADARRGSIDAELSLDELATELDDIATELREPRATSGATPDELLTKLRTPNRRTRGASLDDVAAELREPRATGDTSLIEVAAELRRLNRRRGAALDQVAAELREPSRRRGASLEEVSNRLRKPSGRLRGASLDEVAAKLREPTSSRRGQRENIVEGGALDFVLPARTIAMELVGGRGHYERVIAAVTQAQTSVWIATANAKELMVEDPRAKPGRRRSMKRASYVSILALLDDLASRGVELRLLHAELPSGPFREELARHPHLLAGGLALRRCPRVHMKAVIVDGELLYLGSANWTGAGLGAKGSGRRNFELGFVTGDAQLLDQVQAIYERVWSGGECDACKLRDDCPGPLDELATARS